jgi:hypothetical protein
LIIENLNDEDMTKISIPQINPETAISDKEPLRTLSRTRKWHNQVYFGQNALHDQQGILHVNDTLIIHKYDEDMTGNILAGFLSLKIRETER